MDLFYGFIILESMLGLFGMGWYIINFSMKFIYLSLNVTMILFIHIGLDEL